MRGIQLFLDSGCETRAWPENNAQGRPISQEMMKLMANLNGSMGPRP